MRRSAACIDHTCRTPALPRWPRVELLCVCLASPCSGGVAAEPVPAATCLGDRQGKLSGQEAWKYVHRCCSRLPAENMSHSALRAAGTDPLRCCRHLRCPAGGVAAGGAERGGTTVLQQPLGCAVPLRSAVYRGRIASCTAWLGCSRLAGETAHRSDPSAALYWRERLATAARRMGGCCQQLTPRACSLPRMQPARLCSMQTRVRHWRCCRRVTTSTRC